MVQKQTLLKIIDNSGAKTVRCIDVLGGLKKKTGNIGDILIVSVVELRNRSKKTSKVYKGNVYRALLVQTKKSKRLKDGSYMSFSSNSAVLIKKDGKPLGTRILSPLPKLLKKKKFSKFVSLSIRTV